MIETSQTKSDTALLSPWTLLSISLFIVIVALLTVNDNLTYWWMVESGVNRLSIRNVCEFISTSCHTLFV